MKKRVMAAFLVALMTISMFGTSAEAKEKELECVSVAEALQEEISEPVDLFEVLNGMDKIAIDTGVSFVEDGIETIVSEHAISMLADNQAPVAELRTVILNPESMIDGNLTTETQIAWLWSFNGVDFTYDPDGDEIVQYLCGGVKRSDINASIIGSITDNNGKQIGFATQFQTPAQYVLYFQAMDSNGALSDVAPYMFTIEPADGNTRPVCKIGYSSDTVITNQLMLINWQLSTDNDAGDSVVDYDSIVYIDNAEAGSLKDNQLEGEPTIFSFKQPGNYTVWIRVADTHGAYSDWAVFSIQVESVTISFQVKGISELESDNRWWVNDVRASNCTNVEASWNGAKYLCETYGSTSFPQNLPNTFVMSDAFEVSGTALSASGDPVANTSVRIEMPMTYGRGIDQTVLTDSNGNFSYKPSLAEYWIHSKYEGSSIKDYSKLGDFTGTQTQYIRFSPSTGTNYIYPTSVKVSVGGEPVSKPVTCEVGYWKNPRVGNLECKSGVWSYWR